MTSIAQDLRYALRGLWNSPVVPPVSIRSSLFVTNEVLG
jgi:hypothetical protein